MRVCCLIIAVALLQSPVFAETVEPPLRVTLTRKDRAQLAGELVGYDATGIEIKSRDGQVSRVPWLDLDGRSIFVTHQRLFGPSPTAEQWMALGRMLLAEEEPKWSDAAFANAVKKDTAMADRVAELKAARAEKPAKAAAAAAPVDVPIDPLEGKLWETFTDEEQTVHVTRLKAFADDVKRKLDNGRLRLFETPYLLFYTDLDEGEARRWQALLDRMYDLMLQTFDIPKGTNVWRGKAVVFVFRTRADFVKYEATIENNNVNSTTAGICHSGGDVRIAFYRQPDPVTFGTVLVHEASHGFLHRYRSPVHITEWINEGLAEWIAYQLVPESDWKSGRIKSARDMLNRKGTTEDMFRNWNGSWHYGVAYTLTEYMIARNKQGYVQFINAIKDGKEWPAALEEDYGTLLDRLVHFYGLEFIGRPLRP